MQPAFEYNLHMGSEQVDDIQNKGLFIGSFIRTDSTFAPIPKSSSFNSPFPTYISVRFFLALEIQQIPLAL